MGSWISAVLSAANSLTAGTVLLFLLRLTLIAAMGRLALALFPRASAASRHLVATVTLAALVALPVVMAVVPAWKLPILPRQDTLRVTAPALSVTTTETFVRRSYDVVDGDVPFVAASPRANASAPRVVVPGARSDVPQAPISWPLALALVLIAVSELMLLRCALSLAAAAWFARCADDVAEPRLLAAFDSARDQLDVARKVNLRITPRVSVPVVAGVFHPTLLLPSEARGWNRERLDVVFLHELAHVQRLDTLSLVVARVAGGLYWFHPIVRGLALEARRECEQACDDRVLASGIRASVYAEHLLTIARTAAARDPLGNAVLAIARPSNLEQRLSSILSLGLDRAPASRRAVALTAAIGALLLLPLASVHVTAAPARTPTSKTDTLVWRSNRMAPVAQHTTNGVSRPPAPAAPAAPAVPAAPAAPAEPATPPPAGDSWGGSWRNASNTAPNAYSERSGRDWYSRARRNYERDRYSESGDQYMRAARAGYNIETSFYNAACSYALAHQTERALAALRDAVHAGWDDADHMDSDDDLDSIRRDRRYKQLVEEVRNADPDEGDRKSAAAEFEALRSQGSTDSGDWGSAGVELMHSGDPAKAVDAFETQIKLKPTSNALYNLACAHAINGNHPAAYAALERAIAAGFGSASHMRKDDDLDALHGEKRFDELVRMTELLELNEENLNDNEPGGWSKTLPRYQRVSQQYPNVGRAWFNLGYAQLRARRFEESRASFERGLELGYRRGTSMYDLACVSAQLRDAGEAVKWLNRAKGEGMELAFYLATDRDLDPIRSDSRFREFKRSVGDETFERGRKSLKQKLDKLGRALDDL